MKALKIIVAGALAGGTLVAAPALSAQADWRDFGSTNVCLWGNNDYRWMIHQRAGGVNKTYNLAGDANGEMDSWANRSGTNARGYEHVNGTGDCQTLWAASRDSSVVPYNSDEVPSTNAGKGC